MLGGKAVGHSELNTEVSFERPKFHLFGGGKHEIMVRTAEFHSQRPLAREWDCKGRTPKMPLVSATSPSPQLRYEGPFLSFFSARRFVLVVPESLQRQRHRLKRRKLLNNLFEKRRKICHINYSASGRNHLWMEDAADAKYPFLCSFRAGKRHSRGKKPPHFGIA